LQEDGWPHIDLVVHGREAREATEVREAASIERAREVAGESVVWTSLGPLPRWVPGPTTRWAPRTTRLVPHGT
jgi:hypothetical protein